MKHLIIGAGITGLYLAYKLLSQDIKASDIIIFEKSDRIGGRIYTHENRGYKYSAGAGRLGKKHKYVIDTRYLKQFEIREGYSKLDCVIYLDKKMKFIDEFLKA